MRTMVAEKLKVPGAELHYEIRGRGPAMLMIPGGPTDAGIFTSLADQLQDRYTVTTYDPRGNSRSTFEGGPPDIRVEVHADDAARLIASVDEGPAYVFGSSGGALYGLDLAAFYPDHVRALVAHEPPVTTLLPDAGRWRMLNEDVHSTYVTRGLPAAMTLFDEATGLGDRACSDCSCVGSDIEMFERIERNMDLFFRVLIPSMAGYVPAIDVLRTGRPAIVVAGGDASGAQLPYRAATVLARKLGTAVSHFPGDHGGFVTHAAPFAERLHAVFAATGR